MPTPTPSVPSQLNVEAQSSIQSTARGTNNEQDANKEKPASVAAGNNNLFYKLLNTSKQNRRLVQLRTGIPNQTFIEQIVMKLNLNGY